MNSDMILFIVMAIVGVWMSFRSTIFTGKGNTCLAELPFYYTVGFIVGEFYTAVAFYLILWNYSMR